MWNVVLTEPIDPAGIELLRSCADVHYVSIHGASVRQSRAALEQADALIVRMRPVDAALLDQAPRLRLVSRHGVGYDTVDVAALSERGIALAVAGDVNAVAVAEHTLCLMLALARRLRAYDAAARRGDFAFRLSATSIELHGKSVLLLGFGRIGQEVARRCRAFGMHVAAHDPLVPAETIRAQGCEAVPDLFAWLPKADFVSLHAPLTDETARIIDEQALARMKPSAFLINTARGGEVEEEALLAALRSGQIAGAGLDVFDPYPPSTQNPLFTLDNVLVTPHSAGLTRECAARIARACVQNVLDAMAGRLDLSLVVNAGDLPDLSFCRAAARRRKAPSDV